MAYSEQLWQDAKKKCRLTDEDIARAKRLGLNPRSLIKNNPSKCEPWKAPVSEWLSKKTTPSGWMVLFSVSKKFFRPAEQVSRTL